MYVDIIISLSPESTHNVECLQYNRNGFSNQLTA